MDSQISYRADIDGLRAIAVLSVVLNHAGIALFPGGFIGVDIFLVISGYLITSIIMREINAGKFSLVKFYERRIRRIYPALFAMLAFTVIATMLLYNAQNLRDFGKSLIATTFFFSNIHFWTETGYFERPAQLKPLLHTWSLAVEEQFYIFFPLLMLGLARYVKPRIAQILTGIAILSFSLDLFTLQSDASGAFYFAHLRAWELLIGGILALNPFPTKTNLSVRNFLSLLGLGMTLAPIFLYTSNTAFPGFAAALPVLGAALIIYSGIEDFPFVSKLLSVAPLVFIGQISYSLYLWHWNLIVFGKYYAIKSLTPQEMFGLLLVIFIISILSWHFVEKPFREKSILQNRSIFIYAASVMSLAAVVGAVIYFYYDTRSARTENVGERTWAIHCQYQKNGYKNKNLPKGCPLGVKKQDPSFLLWGDSFGFALSEGITLSASKHHIAGQLVFSNGCSPALGIEREDIPCLNNNNAIIQYITQHPELKTVILVSHWTSWVEGSSYNFTKDTRDVALTDTLSKSEQHESNAVLAERGLERAIQKLYELHRKVVIINQVPEIGYDVPSANFIAQRTGRDANEIIAPSLKDYLQRSFNSSQILNRLAEKYNIQIIEPWKALCNDAQCLAVVDQKPLYMDDYHLSVFGSQYISHIYDPLFAEMEKSK